MESGLDSVINYELGKVTKDSGLFVVVCLHHCGASPNYFASDICHKNEGSVATCVHEILSDILLFHANNPTVWPQWEVGA